MQETPVQFLGQEDPRRRDRLITPVFVDFPGGLDSKESACKAGDMGSVPGLGRSPGGWPGNPLQYSCLDNPHRQRSLAGYSPWDPKESDMTEWLSTAQVHLGQDYVFSSLFLYNYNYILDEFDLQGYWFQSQFVEKGKKQDWARWENHSAVQIGIYEGECWTGAQSKTKLMGPNLPGIW